MPVMQIAATEAMKKKSPCRAAGHKLSARQPRVFGVSRCTRKLIVNQTGKMTQDHGWDVCNFQMNSATMPERASVSTNVTYRRVLLMWLDSKGAASCGL